MVSNSIVFGMKQNFFIITLRDARLMYTFFRSHIERRKRQFKHFHFNNGGIFEKKRHSLINAG